MFKSFSAPDLVSSYRQGSTASSEIAAALEAISELPGVDELALVTHLGSVVITTAPNWQEERAHPGIGIVPRKQGGFAVSLFDRAGHEVTGRSCDAAELTTVLFSLVHRLLAR